MQLTLPPEGARQGLEQSLLDAARRVEAQIEGADGAGATVLLGEGSVFAGSNAFTEALDQVQYGLNQGPCLSAVADERLVRSDRIGSGERRWPVFTPPAAALKLRSVLSVPIRSSEELIGSINLYSRTPAGFAPLNLEALLASAEAAASSLRGIRLLALAEAGARTLAEAVQARSDIDLAVGILMHRYTTSATQASALLTQLARQDGVTKAEAARSVFSQGLS